MDKQQIITIVLTVIVPNILSAFLGVIFNKIFAAYNPDVKKITSVTKKVFLFTFKYILPISNLIYVYIKFTIDKYFIFITEFLFFVILFNLIIDIVSIPLYKLFDRIIGILKSQQNINEITNDSINRIADKLISDINNK